ncbi:MAG: SynChlorMet cassette radical SAM/SPASM protein ScmF [Desulfobulbales bacterium]|nr:SynChlorMet cassette radical SAM/SPASM protein ScmF [Desulfobulbales bacterium]
MTEALYKKKSLSLKFPLSQLYFYLTEGCNLCCRHCWLAPSYDPDASRYALLDFELFQKIIAEALPLGLTGVKLTGGEPLLHPDFSAFLQVLQQKKLHLVLETNGLLCSHEIAGQVARLQNPFVCVSLDGADAATHDSIRGVAGAFAKAKTAIGMFAAHNINVQVIMSVMQDNVEQVRNVTALAEKLGAASVKFNIIQPTGRGEAIHNGAAGLAIKDAIKLGRKVETELAAGTPLKLFFDYPAAFRSLRRLAADDDCGVCSILSILGVLPTGEYALCGIGSHVDELVFGKAGEDSLAKVWHEHATLRVLRQELPGRLEGICARCLMKHICLGACLAQNYYRTKSLWAPFWFCQLAEQNGLFPDSRLDLPSK